MRLRPTLRASHLSWAGIVTIALGIIVTHGPMVAYGSAMLLGVAISQSLTFLSVARARAAGFEMLWRQNEALARSTRSKEIVLEAELRNRDSLPTRFRKLSVSHAPGLEISVFPQQGEVPARGSLIVRLAVRGHRVGYHGIFGLTLHSIRAPGLFTVPLAFSNPFVLEVLPRPVKLGLAGAQGGRSHNLAIESAHGSRQGEGMELRELREHMPGDAYKRIAWKASARRGKLLVIEREQEDCDSVFFVIDASIDSSSGVMGRSSLDKSIDITMRNIDMHLTRGDSVGLALVGSRVLCEVPAGRGPQQRAALLSALTLESHTADADRSDWDKNDVAAKVYEHACAIDSEMAGVNRHDHQQLVAHAQRIMARAPVKAAAPQAPQSSERLLRQYLLSFGIQPPPRSSSDRHQTERQIANLLRQLKGKRTPPSLVYLLGRPPQFDTPSQLLNAMKTLSRGKKRCRLQFIPLLDYEMTEAALADDAHRAPSSTRGRLVHDAVMQRQRIAAEDGITQLRKLGIKATVPHKY